MSDQLLEYFGQLGDFSCNVLRNMGGKILGYNNLQAQKAQFQQMFIALTKGQEDLKALIIKDKTKKPKKQTGVLNLCRRFRGPAKQALDFATTSDEGDNQGEHPMEEKNNPRSEEDEHDYFEEQYPPADDKYKQLEDQLNAMEI